MGQLSKKLYRRLTTMAAPPAITPRARGRTKIPTVPELIARGLDPVHAAYVFVQNITSVFAEGVSQLPEMKRYAQAVSAAEDEYMPSGPPLSPLTGSYFTCWAFFDLLIDGKESLADCLIEANEIVGLNPDQLTALQHLARSRMGVYQQFEGDGSHIHLRELLTDEAFPCHCASGYRGTTGALWYVRLLPPLVPELANYHIAFTTPYILQEANRDDWSQFLKRSMLALTEGDQRERLHRFLKRGFDRNYWNEFVLRAYRRHEREAIFLAGIPDLPATLPHA